MSEFVYDMTHRYLDFSSSVVEQGAKEMKLQYDEFAPLDPDETGMYNNPQMAGVEADRIRMLVDGLECEYYFARVTEKGHESLRYVANGDAGIDAARYIVSTFSIKVPQQLPSVYIEARFNEKYRWKIERRLPEKLRAVDLEGDFNDFFRVYVANQQSARTAFEVLAPNLMYDLLVRGEEVDIELAGNRIYFYRQLRFTTSVDEQYSVGADALGVQTILVKSSTTAEITYDEYWDRLEYYKDQVQRYAKIARQVGDTSHDQPLYAHAVWPNRHQLNPEARLARVIYGVPIGLIGISMIVYVGLMLFNPQSDWLSEYNPNGWQSMLVVGLMLVTVLTAIVGIAVYMFPKDLRYRLRMIFGDASARRSRRRLIERYKTRDFNEVRWSV